MRKLTYEQVIEKITHQNKTSDGNDIWTLMGKERELIFATIHGIVDSINENIEAEQMEFTKEMMKHVDKKLSDEFRKLKWSR